MRRRSGRGRVHLVAVAALCGLAFPLASCGAWEPLQATACPSWVRFETPADAVEDSDAVFIGTVTSADGTAHSMEVEMSAWTVGVEEVLAGDEVAAGETVRVVSMADPCSGEAVYETGDPLDAVGDSLLIFAYSTEGALWTLTPYQGVLPAPADGGIPEEWPAP